MFRFDWAEFLKFILVFVSGDFEIGTNFSCEVYCQSRMGLSFKLQHGQTVAFIHSRSYWFTLRMVVVIYCLAVRMAVVLVRGFRDRHSQCLAIMLSRTYRYKCEITYFEHILPVS